MYSKSLHQLVKWHSYEFENPLISNSNCLRAGPCDKSLENRTYKEKVFKTSGRSNKKDGLYSIEITEDGKIRITNLLTREYIE